MPYDTIYKINVNTHEFRFENRCSFRIYKSEKVVLFYHYLRFRYFSAIPVKKHNWWKLTKRGSPKSKHVAWAELLYRAFGVQGWVCDGCDCRMTLRAVVVGGYAVSRIIIIKGFVRAGRLGVSPP